MRETWNLGARDLENDKFAAPSCATNTRDSNKKFCQTNARDMHYQLSN